MVGMFTIPRKMGGANGIVIPTLPGGPPILSGSQPVVEPSAKSRELGLLGYQIGWTKKPCSRRRPAVQELMMGRRFE